MFALGSPAAFPRRDLDGSEELREHVRALRVVRGLLPLDRRPLRMTRHRHLPSARERKYSWSAGLSDQLRMERRRQQVPLLRAPRGGPRARQHADVRPDVLDPRRPDEDPPDRVDDPSTSTSASNESTWRPYAFRRTVMSIEREQRLPAYRPARPARSCPRTCRGSASRRELAPGSAPPARMPGRASRSSWTRRRGSRGRSTSASCCGRAHLDRRGARRGETLERARGSLPAARGRRPSRGHLPLGYQPRSCKRVSRVPISRPGIGSPRPCDTFARTPGR